jgi:hypothetical protein
MDKRYAYKIDRYSSYLECDEIWEPLITNKLYSSLEAIEEVIGETIPRSKPTYEWEINDFEYDWDLSDMGEPVKWRGSIEGGDFDKLVEITRVELSEEFCTALERR